MRQVTNTHTRTHTGKSVGHNIFCPIRGVTRPRPSPAHLARNPEEDAMEHRPAAGRRLRSGQRQRGVYFIPVSCRGPDTGGPLTDKLQTHKTH